MTSAAAATSETKATPSSSAKKETKEENLPDLPPDSPESKPKRIITLSKNKDQEVKDESVEKVATPAKPSEIEDNEPSRGTVSNTDGAYKSAKSWETLDLPEKVLNGVYACGFTSPSAIQAESLPVVMKKQNVIAQAKAGSGKTAAFGIGMICHALAGGRAVCVAPTRELAHQVACRVQKLASYTGLKICLLISEASNTPEIIKVACSLYLDVYYHGHSSYPRY